MLRLAGSCRNETVALFHTYQIGKPCPMSSVGKHVELRDLLLLLVEIGIYLREHFGSTVRHVAPATLCHALYWGNLLCVQETMRRMPIVTFF